MRTRLGNWILASAALFIGLAASQAAAVELESASLRISLGALSPAPIEVVSSNGTSVGAGLTGTIGSGVVLGTTVFTGITSSPPISQVAVTVTAHAAGNFVPAGGPGGGIGGALTLQGASRIIAYGGAVTLVSVPLSPIGQPGAFFSTVVNGTITVQAAGTGWTTGVASIMVPPTAITGATQTPETVTMMGADQRGTDGGGRLTLVTPLVVRTNLAGDVPSFAVLELNYVPEPGQIALMISGAAVLALAHVRRRRNS